MQFLIDVTLVLFYLFAFLLVCAWCWRFWKMYINQRFLNALGKDMIMLEIKLPRDIFKSPLAMEIAIASLIQGGGVGNWYQRNIQGNLPLYSSLEIASIEGVIHFYIRAHKKFKELIESNLYAQYPGIEILVADDYTTAIRYHHLSKDVDLSAATYPLGKTWVPKDNNGDAYKTKDGEYKMPADFFPIRTYVDFGLDKDPKEEFKTDPLTPLLEFMGSLGKGEHAWYQILIQDESPFNGKKFAESYVNSESHEHYTLKGMADKYKKQLRTLNHIKPGDLVYDAEGNVKQVPTGQKDADGNPILKDATYNFKEPKAVSKAETALTQEEKDELEMINRKLSKPVVRAIVRLMYVAKKDSMNYNNIQGVLAIMRPFNSNNRAANQFGLSYVDPYEYPWQNSMGRRLPWRKEEVFEAFVEREGFYPHVPERKGWDKREDLFFWAYGAQARKKWRMLYESIVHPFDHPHAEVISLNLEELATLWHFPGAVAGTPTLPRLDSNKGVAPPNLPQ